jgi:hypothetical protein
MEPYVNLSLSNFHIGNMYKNLPSVYGHAMHLMKPQLTHSPRSRLDAFTKDICSHKDFSFF